MGKGASQCVVGPIDVPTRGGRDPFARPGAPGNRWLNFGCDGEIPAKYRQKVEQAAALAYALSQKRIFVQTFDKIVTKVAKGQPRSYLDALDAMTLNFADTSTNPVVVKEMAEAVEAHKQDPKYQIEGGFTIGLTGKTYIREFALRDWSAKQIAGLISHEATHVAGAPGDLFTEVVLATLDQYGYPRHP